MGAMQQALLAGNSVAALPGIEAYAGVTGLHSLKRKWTGYSGSCIRVRRSSDNAEQDIGFTSAAIDAPVDSAAAVAFCGAGNGFVTKVYNQSGGAAGDLIQATSTKQARCVNAGVWDGFIRFDGTDDGMQSTNNSGTVAVYNACLLLAQRSTVSASHIGRGTTIGGSGNQCAWVNDPALSPNSLCAYISNGTNYERVNFDVSKGPSLTVARWVAWDYTQASVATRSRLYAGATAQAINGSTAVGTVSMAAVGTAQKWDVAWNSGGAGSSYCDMNFAAALFVEGAVSDANKAAMQAILER